jgi:anti-anti-sigma factor
MADLQITVSQEQGRVPVTIFHLTGAVNADSYEKLENKAGEVIRAGAQALLLDLSQVTYMSSAGLRALHTIFMMMRTEAPDESDEAIREGVTAGTFKSSHLKLLNPRPPVLDVLKMSGFDMYLEIHDKLNEAVASF